MIQAGLEPPVADAAPALAPGAVVAEAEADPVVAEAELTPAPDPRAGLLARLQAMIEAHERLLSSTRELEAAVRDALGADGADVTVSAGPFAGTTALREFEQALAGLPEVRQVVVRGYEGDDRAVVEEKAARLGFDHGQIGGLADQRLHRPAVELAIGLGARALHGGALAPIEHPELNPGGVGGARHQPVEGVDFAHQMALAEPADRGVARHRADRFALLRHQRRACAEARRRRGRFAAGVTATNDDDVVSPHSLRLGRFT